MNDLDGRYARNQQDTDQKGCSMGVHSFDCECETVGRLEGVDGPGHEGGMIGQS